MYVLQILKHLLKTNDFVQAVLRVCVRKSPENSIKFGNLRRTGIVFYPSAVRYKVLAYVLIGLILVDTFSGILTGFEKK